MKLQKFDRTKHDGETPDGQVLVFWCPACKQHHLFNVGRQEGPVWSFNGDMEKPTFSPSLLYATKTPRCHLFVTDGRISFCADCGHELAGQTVDLPEMPEIPEDQRW